jgi:hypothetical protein
MHTPLPEIRLSSLQDRLPQGLLDRRLQLLLDLLDQLAHDVIRVVPPGLRLHALAAAIPSRSPRLVASAELSLMRLSK